MRCSKCKNELQRKEICTLEGYKVISFCEHCVIVESIKKQQLEKMGEMGEMRR